MIHIAIIGRGMIGSAAARHLARAGYQVTLIGPAEPNNKAIHGGVFGSHYDAGRITRALDPSLYWSDITRASIARYTEIKAQSGIAFFTNCGSVMLGPQDSDFIRNVSHVQKANAVACEKYSGADLKKALPFFRFERDSQVFYEEKGAGYINPRKLVEAQSNAAMRAGATWVEATVLAITENSGGVLVSTDKGEISADQVLVAAGGFTNMVLPQPVGFQNYARTISFFEVSENEAARLADMPTLVMEFVDGRDPYLLPPIRYPNGKMYLKLGCELADVPLNTLDELKAWFKGVGTAKIGAFQQAIMMEIMPDLRVEAIHTEACMTTFSADDRPIITRQSDRITVATAGCGRGAKCSDELGRMAAELCCKPA